MANNAVKVSDLPTAANVALTDRLVVLRQPNVNPSVRTVAVSTLIQSIGYANSSTGGLIKIGAGIDVNNGIISVNASGDAAQAYSNAISYTDTAVATAYANAIAYTNAAISSVTSNTGNFQFVNDTMSLNNSDNMYIENPNNAIFIDGLWLAQLTATQNSAPGGGSGNSQSYSWVYQEPRYGQPTGYAEHGAYVQANNFYSEMYVTTNSDNIFYVDWNDGHTFKRLNYNSNGIFNLPAGGDYQIDGVSVITPPHPTPNIAYTGTFIGYPDVLPVTTGKNVIYTANGSTVSNNNLYWWDDQFYDGNYDLSGATSIALNNIGGLTGQFSFGSKSLNVLASIDLGQVAYVSNYFTTNMPSLDYISAGSLAHIQDNLRIYSMDKAETVFDFSNLRYIRNELQFDWNNVLTTFPSFPELKHIGYIYINNNDALNNNALEFPALTYLSFIYFYDNGGIVHGPSFPNLTTTGYIYIVNNPNMVYAPNYPALVTCTSTIDIFNNAALINTPIFTNLQTVNGNLNIYNCPLMPHAPTLTNLQHVNGNIYFNDNTVMNGGFNFSSLKSVYNFYAENCALSQEDVDYILSILVGLDGTNGTTLFNGLVTLRGGTSSPPSAAGLASIATLQGRGCNVYVNS